MVIIAIYLSIILQALCLCFHKIIISSVVHYTFKRILKRHAYMCGLYWDKAYVYRPFPPIMVATVTRASAILVGNEYNVYNGL